MRQNPGAPAHVNRLHHLFPGDALFDRLQDLRIARFDAEADRAAAGGLHFGQNFFGNGVDPGKRCPLQFQPPVYNFIAHGQTMLSIGGKQIIGNVNLMKIQRVHIFHFIDNLAGAAIANPGPHHFAAHTKYTLKRASAAGGQADRHS